MGPVWWWWHTDLMGPVPCVVVVVVYRPDGPCVVVVVGGIQS